MDGLDDALARVSYTMPFTLVLHAIGGKQMSFRSATKLPGTAASRIRVMQTLLYSCLTRSLSEAASSVATSMIAAIAIKPAVNEPVKSLSQPIMLGPTKPPNTPMVLMKANPPAAPTPVKNRVGTFQKMARAEVTPISAMVKPARATSSELEGRTDAMKPIAPRKQATERLATFLPVRSICQAHRIIAAEAKR